MKLRSEEFLAAKLFQEKSSLRTPSLTESQLAQIREAAKRHGTWSRSHLLLHNFINLSVLSFLFGVDYWILCKLPYTLPWILKSKSFGIFGGIICGLLHGIICCSIATFSVHEGAAHNILIQGKGRVWSTLAFLSNNCCRLFLADPVHYSKGHWQHHSKFGTLEDGSFTNFVFPQRFMRSILPLQPFFNFSDFIPWVPEGFTRSRMASLLLSSLYAGIYAFIMIPKFGLLFTLVALYGVGLWVGCALDRLREFAEHNRMPLDAIHGTRELGLGPWALTVGGGPWGQPCHLSHHLAPVLPWYQQIRLHYLLLDVLSKEQKGFFLIRPITGFPLLLKDLFAEQE